MHIRERIYISKMEGLDEIFPEYQSIKGFQKARIFKALPK